MFGHNTFMSEGGVAHTKFWYGRTDRCTDVRTDGHVQTYMPHHFALEA